MKELALMIMAASTLAMADAKKPACEGEEVDTNLLGSYRLTIRSNSRDDFHAFELSDTHAYLITDDGTFSVRAWSCSRKGAQFLVYAIPDGTYWSQWISQSGDYLAVEHVSPKDFPIGAKEVAALYASVNKYSLYRRQHQ